MVFKFVVRYSQFASGRRTVSNEHNKFYFMVLALGGQMLRNIFVKIFLKKIGENTKRRNLLFCGNYKICAVCCS